MPTFQGSVPPRPATIEEYPQAIADYLNKAGDAALGPPCLADLLAAWQMPEGRGQPPPGTSTGVGRCVLGNTDADPENEVIVSLSASEAAESLTTQIVVFDNTPSGYQVAYLSPPLGNGKTDDGPYAILAADDLTGDGAGDLAFAGITCGAHTCTWHVHVVTGIIPGYRELTPPDGLSLATANVRIDDTDGNGTKEIILHGGIIQSVGAGYQRAVTDIYAWDGQQYSLVSTWFDPSDLRYFRIRDGDAAFEASDYSGSAQLYIQALTDPSLRDVTSLEGQSTHDELLAYSRFRLGLSYEQLGDPSAASDQIESAIANYPETLIGRVAAAFRDGSGLYDGNPGNVAAGCRAAVSLANQFDEAFQKAWDYGYANPGFDAVEFCPF